MPPPNGDPKRCICGAPKRPRSILCRSCYMDLPKEMRTRIHFAIRQDMRREIWHEAMKWTMARIKEPVNPLQREFEPISEEEFYFNRGR